MDANRLTALLRSWGSRPTRRDLTRALSGTLLAAPLAMLLGTDESAAKKKHRKKKKKKCKGKKKCGKKCIAKTSCCVDGAEVADGAICGGPCDLCQAGVCASTCGADQTCLANGSCGKTCTEDGQCLMDMCSCNEDEGGDPVCRVPVGIDPTCEELTPCEDTADCPAGTVCSTICNPSRCVPLCDV